MAKSLVIYAEKPGAELKARLIEMTDSNNKDSQVAWVWGLPEEYEVLLTLHQVHPETGQIQNFDMTRHELYIEEMPIEFDSDTGEPTT